MPDVLLLGSVKAHANGHDHALGGVKQRALLARLANAHGHPLPADRLIDDLWGEAPPRDPGHAFQARVSRLRSAVPIDIKHTDGGYRIDPTQVQVDSVRFEKLCEQGRWLLSERDHWQAVECLREALGLWRGPAFADLPDIPALRAESVRLENLRTAALADRIDLDLARGHHATVIPELRALIEENPLFERYWGQLMTALYCDRRGHEALDVFSQARATFADHLGGEPSKPLGRLHLKVLQGQSPASLLRWPSAEAAPSGPDQRCGGDGSHLRHTRAVTSNQADALAALVRRRGALILTGPAGIGKTHLLRTVSTTIESRIGFAPVFSASPLSKTVPLGAFIGVNGLSSEARNSPAALIDFFARRRSMTVLLVDDVDDLDEESLFVVTQLIRTSRLPAIVSSRDLTSAPPELRALYDSGDITEVEVQGLSDTEAGDVIVDLLDGQPTPDTLPPLLAAARGNPLHLREVITGSLNEGRLLRTRGDWRLHGAPAATPRLAQLVGEHSDGQDEAIPDAATNASRSARSEP